MNSPEIVSAAAAVVSAVGGAFAAFAASRSAKSAQIAQEAAAAAEHRAALRQIGVTATEILIETGRITARANALKSAYRSLAILAGQYGGSRQQLWESAIDEKLKHASELSKYAKSFASTSGKLDHAPPEETDRVQVRLTNTLSETRALREDLERELFGVEGQSAAYRDKAIMGSMK